MSQIAEKTMDTRLLLAALWRRKWTILLAAVAGLGLALLIGLVLIPERYAVTLLFRVDTGVESANSQSISAARDLTDSCGVLLRSRACLETLTDLTGIEVTSDMLSWETVESTEFFSVTVVTSGRRTAKNLAKGVEQVLLELAKDHLSGATLVTVDGSSDPEILRPDAVLLISVGALVGLLLSCGWIIVRKGREMV